MERKWKKGRKAGASVDCGFPYSPAGVTELGRVTYALSLSPLPREDSLCQWAERQTKRAERVRRE